MNNQINILTIVRTIMVSCLAMFSVVTTGFAGSHAMKPAVIYDMGGKFDKSFNEGVWNGVKKFTEETGIEVMEFEVTNETQREQAMRRMVERGATIVLGVGFAQADAIAARIEVLINSYTLLSLMGGLTLDSVQLIQPKNVEN